MYVLVKYSKNIEKLIEKTKEIQLNPVILFSLTLNNKEQTKQDIQKIKQLNQEFKNKNYSTAIKITIEKQDNTTSSTINSLKQDFDIIIGQGGLNKINRFFLEQTQIDFLADPHSTKFKSKIDFIHHFNSGLNHILVKIAKEKKISFLVSLNFTSNKPKYILREFARINQNLKFARKYQVSTLINFIIKEETQIKSQNQIEHILHLFNLSTEQKKESINILKNKIFQNQKKKSKNYICEEVEFLEE